MELLQYLMSKEIIHNKNAFLSSELVEKCFINGKVTNVDKTQTGNGFTTAFLNLQPSANKINIIIAPNKAVIQIKQRQYLEGNFNTRIKFFFKEGSDSDFENADVLFFVADSFLLMKDQLKEISHKIDKVLIDEYHSIEIQSLFRSNLKDFIPKVKFICDAEFTSITTVTATPNLYSNADILIKNELIKESTIIVSKDREKALNRIKIDIKEGKNVVLFTNSPTAIYHLRDYKNELKANFIIGKSLARSIVELIKIIPDANSKLMIVSSKGFEGFDIHFTDAKVYFFEDRANEYETFYISNLHQAINRTRKGASYIEYNRLELSKRRPKEFKNIDFDVENFVNDKTISNSAKMKKDYKKFSPFVIFSNDPEGAFYIKKNEIAIQLHKEKLLYDLPFPANEFKEFLETRNIKIEHLNEVNNRISKKVKVSTKVKNLKSNAEYIYKLDLFGSDYKIQIKDFHSQKDGAPVYDNRALYLNHFNAFLRCKNYKGNRTLSERENIALSLLNDGKKYNNLINETTKTYDIRSIEKYGFTNSLPYRKTFKNKSFNTVCKLVLMFANDRITAPSNWIAHRNYNILTEIGLNEIELIANVFKVKITEVDIKNCFPRILYGINNLELPSDFYGPNKRNKLGINVGLNNFFYDIDQKSSKKDQRKNAVQKFTNFGFNKEVINFLIDRFFETKFKGDLFHFLSFYEKKIINEIKKTVNVLDNNGVIRRHDSIIIFDNRAELNSLNNYEFLSVSGWFLIPEIKVIKMDCEFEAFKKELDLQQKIDKMDNYEFSAYLRERNKVMAL